jgi:methyl-accepting chemotaxis protein
MTLSRVSPARTQTQVFFLLLLLVLGLPASVVASWQFADGALPAPGRDLVALLPYYAPALVASLIAGLALFILLRFFRHLRHLAQAAERAVGEAEEGEAAPQLGAGLAELRELAIALRSLRTQTRSSRLAVHMEQQRLNSVVTACQHSFQLHAEQMRQLLSGPPPLPQPSPHAARRQSLTGAAVLPAAAELRPAVEVALGDLRATTQQLEHFRTISLQGQSTLAGALQQLTWLRSQSESQATAVQELLSRAHTIGEIADTVKLLTSQIDHLALNATIEAARAGEVGRGFTIVANEVRSLAEQSKSATQRMRQVQTEIQKFTSNPLSAAPFVGESIDSAIEATRQVEEVLLLLSGDSAEELERCRQILAFATEQAQEQARLKETMIQLQHKGERLAELTSRNEGLRQLLDTTERELAVALQQGKT